MIKKLFTASLVAGFGYILYEFLVNFSQKLVLPAVSSHYINNGPKELGAANIVTSVVVSYRGLDTLGEVTVLFAASAVVGLLIKLTNTDNDNGRDASELLMTGARLLFPLIVLFGIYVFINGHLTPGGGFQGGAIIASGVMLLVLSKPHRHISHALLGFLESISGVAYVGLGVLGVILAGGFLDNRLLPLGEYNTLLSGGLIPVIYIIIGLKVGSELSTVVVNMGLKAAEREED
ncbi:MAG: sodium:proton antiporter [Deltaproteobacteria bacterium]|nr:sodium:proton antiporter [Deltaproteobacteria bacterium]